MDEKKCWNCYYAKDYSAKLAECVVYDELMYRSDVCGLWRCKNGE